MTTLAHVMNNFDRPRGVTIDLPEAGNHHLEVQGLDEPGAGAATEFTCWTSLSDLERKLFFLRSYESINYTRFDLSALAGADKPIAAPFQRFGSEVAEGAAALLESAGD